MNRSKGIFTGVGIILSFLLGLANFLALVNMAFNTGGGMLDDGNPLEALLFLILALIADAAFLFIVYLYGREGFGWTIAALIAGVILGLPIMSSLAL